MVNTWNDNINIWVLWLMKLSNKYLHIRLLPANIRFRLFSYLYLCSWLYILKYCKYHVGHSTVNLTEHWACFICIALDFSLYECERSNGWVRCVKHVFWIHFFIALTSLLPSSNVINIMNALHIVKHYQVAEDERLRIRKTYFVLFAKNVIKSNEAKWK